LYYFYPSSHLILRILFPFINLSVYLPLYCDKQLFGRAYGLKEIKQAIDAYTEPSLS